MSLLTGFRVVQIGQGLAAAACGRLLADEGALLTHRADRCFRQIIHLSGQQPGNAAGVHQGEITRRIARPRPGLTER